MVVLVLTDSLHKEPTAAREPMPRTARSLRTKAGYENRPAEPEPGVSLSSLHPM